MMAVDPAHRVPYLAFQPDQMVPLAVVPIEDIDSSYYLRLRVKDQPGVLADITRVLAEGAISIDAFFQREPEEGDQEVDVILLTHLCQERAMLQAIQRIEALPTVTSEAVMLRLESFT